MRQVPCAPSHKSREPRPELTRASDAYTGAQKGDSGPGHKAREGPGRGWGRQTPGRPQPQIRPPHPGQELEPC